MMGLNSFKRSYFVVCFLSLGYVLYLYCFVTQKYGSLRITSIWEPKSMFTASKTQLFSTCSSRTLAELVNMPIPTKLHAKVDVTMFEKSGCFKIESNKNGLYRIVHEGNFAHVTCNATKKKFLPTHENDKSTALVSLPGSGNTWVRHLLEELTGIFTGSIYNDTQLKEAFIGEGQDRNVIAVKTHRNFRSVRGKYSHAILIIRDPFAASRANYNRIRSQSHTKIVNKENFDKNGLTRLLDKKLTGTDTKFNIDWICRFEGDILVLFFEKLKTDLLNSLTKMAAFTQSDVTLTKLWCILQNQEGHFHREQVPDWMSRKRLTNKTIEKSIQDWRKAIQTAIKKRTSGLVTN